MFILCILSLVSAEKVKIVSRVNQKYILTILTPMEGNYVRMMKESNIVKPADQSGFEISGDKTVLDNNGIVICNNGSETGVISCLRNSNKQTVFNVIRTGNEVTFKTDNNRCLTIDDYDDSLDAFYLKLNDCREGDLRQRFILANIANTTPSPNPNVVNDVTPPTPLPNEIKGVTPPGPSPNEIKSVTPPAPLPNVVNDVTPPAPSPNVIDGNVQYNNSNPCANVSTFNNGFIPATCNSNNMPILTDGSQFGGFLNPFCFDANRSRGPTSYISIYKFRRPSQPNDCNNHLQ